MATESQIGGTLGSRLFIGTAASVPMHVKDFDPPNGNTDGSVAKDVAGWLMTFEVRKTNSAGAILLTKTVGDGLTIAGTFNAVAASNAQRVTLALTAADLSTDAFGEDGGEFRYSLKRTDIKAILAYGDFIVERATQV